MHAQDAFRPTEETFWPVPWDLLGSLAVLETSPGAAQASGQSSPVEKMVFSRGSSGSAGKSVEMIEAVWTASFAQ